jgi:hypothetical protein
MFSFCRVLCLSVAVILYFASTASAQNSTIIYWDYTSGFQTTLPNTAVTAVAEHTYSTSVDGSYRFGVDWNNDATDQFTINVPSVAGFTVTPENNIAFCTPNSTATPPNQITFTMTSPHICNYTVSWLGTKFTAVLTVTYDGGTGNPKSDAISTFFQPSGVVGDPQFIGLRGQSYQVHGMDGAVYNLITDSNLQVNSRFVFLTEGECPVIDGVADDNCWSHPGSYLGEVSFQQRVEGKLHAALLTAGSAKKGFSMVQVDGKRMQVGDVVTFGTFSMEMTSTHQVTVNTEQYSFALSNSDFFINQGLRSKVGLSKLQSHGLIGQTHSSKTYNTAVKFIEGDVDDYVVADNDIFGNDFPFNQFTQ